MRKSPTVAAQLHTALEENARIRESLAAAEATNATYAAQLNSFEDVQAEQIKAVEELKQQHAQQMAEKDLIIEDMRTVLQRTKAESDDWALRVQRTEHWLDITERYNKKLTVRNEHLQAEMEITLRASSAPVRTFADYLCRRIKLETVFIGPAPRHDPHIEELDSALSFTGQVPQRS